MSTTPTSTTVYQQALPEYAAPYFERLLQRSETESLQGYQPYTGARLAGFTGGEQAAQAGIGALGSPAQIAAATGVSAQLAGAQMPDAFQYATSTAPGSFQAAYSPTAISPGYQAGQFQAAYSPTDISAGYTPGTFEAGYSPTAVSSSYTAGQLGNLYTAGSYAPQFQAGSFSPGYTAGTFSPGYQAGQLSIPGQFNQGIAALYMNPYQEQVTSAAVREIEKGADRARTNISQAAAQAGGRGGYREALERSELQRNVLQQVGDVTAQGRQAAYDQAVRQFEADRQAQMQAFGMQEGARQQQAQLGFAAQQAGEQARQRAAELGLSAQQQADASRQAAEDFRLRGFQSIEAARQAQAASSLAGFQASEGARQAQAQFGLTAQELGGRQALSSAELAARQEAARDASRQSAAQLGITAQQASQQQRLSSAQLAAQQEAAREAARQTQAQFGLNAQQITEQQRLASADLAARQEAAREAARQQQTQLGLAGLQQNLAGQQQRLGAAQTLGQLGQAQQALDIERFGQQEAAGQRQRAMNQASLDVGYQDFLNQLGYTQGQLGFYSNILRGVPVQPQGTVSTFQQQPSLFQSVLGTGLSGLGLYNALRGG